MEPKLPLGYTFEPSPQDLIFYLEYKVVGNPLPTNGFIEECDLYNIDPDELFMGWKNYKVRYFYVKREKKVKGGSRFNRRLGNKATWKGCGNYECNTMATTGSYSDQDGRMDSYQDGIDFGIGDNNQDYENPVMLNAEVDGSQKFHLHENPPTTLITSEDCDNIIDQDGSRDQFLLSNIDHPTPWMMIEQIWQRRRQRQELMIPYKCWTMSSHLRTNPTKTGSEGLSLLKEFLFSALIITRKFVRMKILSPIQHAKTY
ncbi:hypothetical protein ACH5RR_035833 [Cinchona calisaya]|uniref:NAC domain-containing protein n=1 Tax=Cinchona calisaya TaxID=153742 RepID=A0ABD2Y4Z2_9GENT